MKKALRLLTIFFALALIWEGIAWAVDTKISALTAITVLATTLELPVNEGGTATKKLTIQQIQDTLHQQEMSNISLGF